MAKSLMDQVMDGIGYAVAIITLTMVTGCFGIATAIMIDMAGR